MSTSKRLDELEPFSCVVLSHVCVVIEHAASLRHCDTVTSVTNVKDKPTTLPYCEL